MVDVSADAGWLSNVRTTVHIVQAVLQGRWADDPTTLQLPHIDAVVAAALASHGYGELRALVRDATTGSHSKAAMALRDSGLSSQEASDCLKVRRGTAGLCSCAQIACLAALPPLLLLCDACREV